MEAISIDGTDFEESYQTVQDAIKTIRDERRPMLIHAKVTLSNHPTICVCVWSFIVTIWKRPEMRDPYPKMKKLLSENDFSEDEIEAIEALAHVKVKEHFEEALKAEDPKT